MTVIFQKLELGRLLPSGGDVGEAPHDTQEDAGTPQWQMYTAEKHGCSVPGPM